MVDSLFWGKAMEDQSATIDNLLSELMEMSLTIVDLKESVTKSQREAEALLARVANYKAILENIPHKVFLKDKSSVYLFCNEAYARSLNLRPEDIQGKTDSDLLSSEVAEKYALDEKRILKAGVGEALEIKIQWNGEERFALLRRIPVRDSQGNIWGILGIIEDRSERKQAEKEIENLQAQLREIKAAKMAEVQALNETLEREKANRKRIEETCRQMEETHQRLVQENALMATMERILFSAPSEQEAYAQMASQISGLIPYDRFSISSIHPEEGLYVPLFQTGMEIGNFTIGKPHPISQTLEEEILKIGTSLLIQKDVPEDVISRFPILLPYLKAGFQSMLIIPLRRGEEVRGVMNFFSTKENAFTREAQILGERLGSKMAQAQLFFEKKREAENLRRNGQRIRGFIEDHPLPVFSLDPDGKITETNPAFCALIGYALEALKNRSFSSILVSDQLQDTLERLQQAGKGKPQTFETTFLPREGRPRVDVELTFVPIRVGGRVIGIYGMARDITEQKRLRETKEAFQKKYAYMVDNIPIGVWVCAQEKFKFVNYRCAELLGYSLEEFMGKSLKDVLHPEDRETVLQHYSRWLSGEKLPHPYTARFLHKDGTPRWLQNQVYLIPWDQKEAVLNYAIDITKQIRVQEEFTQVLEKMQVLMQSLETLVEGGRRKEAGGA